MVLKVNNLSIWYKNHNEPTLENINFEAKMGECHLITGGIGSGKSTFFWAISKLFTPGTLLRSNGSIDNDLPLIFISQRIKAQILTFNVREELASRLSFQNMKRERRHELVDNLNTKYNLSHLINRNTRNLSAGQQQLIVILANMIDMKEKFVILMDEPLSLLDDTSTKQVKSTISDLVRLGNTVIISDPRPNRYLELNPTIHILQNGNLKNIQESEIQEFDFGFTHPNYLNLEQNIPLNMGIGYNYELQRVETTFPANGIILVTGENGSGKTTLLLTLAKIIKPLTVSNDKFSFPSALYLPQDTFSFFWRETVEDELLESFNRNEFPDWVVDLLNTSPFLLSEGQRKKLALEICFSHDCVLLLDEPTQGLDINSINLFIEKVIRYAENQLVVIATNDKDLIKLFDKFSIIMNFT